mgnify:CR=1 FL=1
MKARGGQVAAKSMMIGSSGSVMGLRIQASYSGPTTLDSGSRPPSGVAGGGGLLAGGGGALSAFAAGGCDDGPAAARSADRVVAKVGKAATWAPSDRSANCTASMAAINHTDVVGAQMHAAGDQGPLAD